MREGDKSPPHGREKQDQATHSPRVTPSCGCSLFFVFLLFWTRTCRGGRGATRYHRYSGRRDTGMLPLRQLSPISTSGSAPFHPTLVSNWCVDGVRCRIKTRQTNTPWSHPRLLILTTKSTLDCLSASSLYSISMHGRGSFAEANNKMVCLRCVLFFLAFLVSCGGRHLRRY